MNFIEHYKMMQNIHSEIENKLDKFLISKKVPNLLFHGSSGSGKRTLVNNYINKIYFNDKTKIKKNVMNVNCSHGKGIKFIRDELKFFAKTNIQSNEGANFKTILLVNADQLTIDAQSALRRCIELFSHNTRFFIIVENKDKLLNPILSRFCEIYVPEYYENEKMINLHIENNKNIIFHDKKIEKIKWIQQKLKNMKEMNHQYFVRLANDMYENGLSCLDLIEYITEYETLDELEKTKIIIYFEKIKSQYRNECLLIFTLFDFIYLREDKNICF